MQGLISKIIGKFYFLALKTFGLKEISRRKVKKFLSQASRSFKLEKEVVSLSVVVPCYKHAHYLKEMFESIINQTLIPNEVIFVNDCSPDNTLEIISGLIVNNLNSGINFKIINNKKNLGQAQTLNIAIRQTASSHIMILNDDDLLMYDAVEYVCYFLKSNPNIGLVGMNAVVLNREEEKNLLAKEKRFIGYYCNNNYDNIKMIFHKPEQCVNYEKFNDLNMTNTGSVFARTVWESVGGFYKNKSKRVVPFSDRDFQLRCSFVVSVAISENVPNCFWRSYSSVDSGINS